MFVVWSVGLAVIVLAVATRVLRQRAAVPWRAGATPLIAAIIAVPLARGGAMTFEDPSLPARVSQAVRMPSVVDWNRYYPLLQNTLRPKLTIPGPIVSDLRQRVSPRQVVVANPQYSCSLAVLLDAYCVNPAHIYGQYYLTAQPYQDRFVHSTEGRDEDWHPFFNDTWPLEGREATFLRDYSVDYLLTDPDHDALISRKLQALHLAVTPEMSRDGYTLYRVRRSGAETRLE